MVSLEPRLQAESWTIRCVMPHEDGGAPRLRLPCIRGNILRIAFTAEEFHGFHQSVEPGNSASDNRTAQIGADLHDVVWITSNETFGSRGAGEFAIYIDK